MNTAIVLGGSGLLGQALVQRLICEGFEVLSPSREELNVLDFSALSDYLLSAFSSQKGNCALFNCVAYTAVDKAEEEAELALALNAQLPARLGRLAQGKNVFLMHYSTDFVFNGLKSTPYTPEDATDPLCVYGASKLAGEKALLELNLPNCAIARTAWLFGHGRKNFVRTILTICEKQGFAKVVQDQVGSPTYASDLALYSLALAKSGQSGLFHVVNSGQTSWHGLAAQAAQLVGSSAVIEPVLAASLALPARRPAYSVLDTGSFSAAAGLVPRPWQAALQEYLTLL